MKNNKKNSLAGLLLIVIGSVICLTVGLPFLSSIFACLVGFLLINFGLQLRGQPSLLLLIQRILYELQNRFF